MNKMRNITVSLFITGEQMPLSDRFWSYRRTQKIRNKSIKSHVAYHQRTDYTLWSIQKLLNRWINRQTSQGKDLCSLLTNNFYTLIDSEVTNGQTKQSYVVHYQRTDISLFPSEVTNRWIYEYMKKQVNWNPDPFIINRHISKETI